MRGKLSAGVLRHGSHCMSGTNVVSVSQAEFTLQGGCVVAASAKSGGQGQKSHRTGLPAALQGLMSHKTAGGPSSVRTHYGASKNFSWL